MVIGSLFSNYTVKFLNTEVYAMADPGFPRVGGDTNRRGPPTYYLTNFPQNCIKMNKFWPRGGRPLAPPSILCYVFK